MKKGSCAYNSFCHEGDDPQMAHNQTNKQNVHMCVICETLFGAGNFHPAKSCVLLKMLDTQSDAEESSEEEESNESESEEESNEESGSSTSNSDDSDWKLWINNDFSILTLSSLKIQKLIADKVEDKNPEDDDGLTPQKLMWNNVELIRIDQNWSLLHHCYLLRCFA